MEWKEERQKSEENMLVCLTEAKELFQREIVLFQRCVKEESGMQKQQGSRNGLVNRARKERKNTEGEGKKKDLDKKKGLGTVG
jgi:hypothetical protein